MFDNWFQTVASTENIPIDFDDEAWYHTFGLTEWQYIPDDDPPNEEPTTMPTQGLDQQEVARRVHDAKAPNLERENDPISQPVPTVPTMPTLLREPAAPIEPPLQREEETNGPHADDSGAPQAIPDQS